jgi:hypothetical protein
MKTWFETKYDEGYENGSEKCHRANLRRLLERRCGLLPVAVLQHLEQLTLTDLETLFARACTANSLAELGLTSTVVE